MSRPQWCIVCDDRKGGCGGTTSIKRKADKPAMQLISCEFCNRPIHVVFPQITRKRQFTSSKDYHKDRQHFPQYESKGRSPVWRAEEASADSLPMP